VCECLCLCDERARAAVNGRAARQSRDVLGQCCGEVVVQSGEEQWRETVDRGDVVIFLLGVM